MLVSGLEKPTPEYVNTVGLDEAKIRNYIQDQDVNESADDRRDTDPGGNPF
jgi:hypothetical protein